MKATTIGVRFGGVVVAVLAAGCATMGRSAPELEIDAEAIAVRDAEPPQVCLDIVIRDRGDLLQMPKIMLIEGQKGRVFVGEADPEVGDTGLAVDAHVSADEATLDVTRQQDGAIVEARRVTVPIRR